MTYQDREIIELALFDLESKSGVRWGPEYMEEFAAAIRSALAEIDALKSDANLVSLNAVNAALAAEIAALKAQRDPLAEMWAALAEYQPQADRDGHGESWRRMCEERTEDAARSIRYAPTAARAARDARDAAAFAEWVLADKNAARVSRAIAAIRRAKGAKHG